MGPPSDHVLTRALREHLRELGYGGEETAQHGVTLGAAEAYLYSQHKRLWLATEHGDERALPKSLVKAVGAYHRALTGQVRDPYALAARGGGTKRGRNRFDPQGQPARGGKAGRLAGLPAAPPHTPAGSATLAGAAPGSPATPMDVDDGLSRGGEP